MNEDFLSERKEILNALRWFVNSKERLVIYPQIYRQTLAYIERQVKERNLQPGEWGIISDIDETIIDNTEYYALTCKENFKIPSHSSEEYFSRYCSVPKRCQPIFGAVEFTHKIYELGGKISLISNRDGSYYDENGSVVNSTIEVLQEHNFKWDQILFARFDKRARHSKITDKNPRFEAVITGNYQEEAMVIVNKIPKMEVIAFIGDNIHDFPKYRQEHEHYDFHNFPENYFLLPNPIYGSWESIIL